MRNDKDLTEIRAIIARHKLWDMIFHDYRGICANDCGADLHGIVFPHAY